MRAINNDVIILMSKLTIDDCEFFFEMMNQ